MHHSELVILLVEQTYLNTQRKKMTSLKRKPREIKNLQRIQEPREEKQQKIENKGLEAWRASERRK